MTNTFAYNCEKLFKKYDGDDELALIRKDIEDAKQGVMTFSEEDKKRVLKLIHERYDDDEDVKLLIAALREWSERESEEERELFMLQDECCFWYDFLHAYGAWKLIGKHCEFGDSDEALQVLVRLQQFDDSVFSEYSAL